MQQRGGDFNSLYYHQHPQPSPANAINYPPSPSPSPSPSAAVSYSSAPPYSLTTYGSTSEFSSSSTSYDHRHQHHPPFPHNSDPVPSLSSPPPPAPQYFAPSESTHGPEAIGIYPSPQHPPHYSPYDPSLLPATATSVIPASSNFYPNPNPNPIPDPNPFSSLYPSNLDIYNSSGQSPRETTSKWNKVSAYPDNKTHHIGADWMTYRPDLEPDVYGSRTESAGDWGPRSTPGTYGDDGYGDGAYAYKGNGGDPYGARGTAPKSSTWSGMFDDYGRAISFPSSDRNKSSSLKVVKAIPKAETLSDDKGNGVQKFRVKLLAESGGQSTMDVLCQVGLDGIRMLDPSTSRTLRIYPLVNVSRCEKFDSSTLAFWSKTSVDIEPRRIRVQSNSYTTSTLLDTITAAIVQLKEIGGRILPPESSKVPERPVEKKKGLTDWMNKLKPTYEEKDHWVPDEAISKCTGCGTDFSTFVRKHHCRNCGDIFCDKCTHGRIVLTADENAQPVRVCDRCMGEVTRRLSSAKESASRSAVVRTHEDLSKKLQEEMERNRRSSLGSKTDGSGRRMKEVACPTCTVHLQVQVPSSGSETIECGVCQHPFLVSSQ